MFFGCGRGCRVPLCSGYGRLWRVHSGSGQLRVMGGGCRRRILVLWLWKVLVGVGGEWGCRGSLCSSCGMMGAVEGLCAVAVEGCGL